MITAPKTLRITCHEKGRPDSFDAEVAADCTVAEILRGLVDAEYLPESTGADSFTVVNGRTGMAIPPDGTLASAEVRDGDVLTVTKMVNGA